jgi:hypothetical protein
MVRCLRRTRASGRSSTRRLPEAGSIGQAPQVLRTRYQLLFIGLQYQAPSVVPHISCVLCLETGVRVFHGPYQSQNNEQSSLLKVRHRGAYWQPSFGCSTAAYSPLQGKGDTFTASTPEEHPNGGSKFTRTGSQKIASDIRLEADSVGTLSNLRSGAVLLVSNPCLHMKLFSWWRSHTLYHCRTTGHYPFAVYVTLLAGICEEPRRCHPESNVGEFA